MSAAEGMILAFDTSTGFGSVALGRAGELLAETTVRVGPGHSAQLMPVIDGLLRSVGATPAELGGVVVGGGPGSFTGLRIAAATAKGLVHALGLPLWAYSGLLATAASCAESEQTVYALFDARRRDVFAAAYRFAEGVHEVMAPAALTVDELIERVGAEPALFTGEAARLHRAELEQIPGARVAPMHQTVPRAAALLWLHEQVPAMGRVGVAAEWEPDYVRASGAERIAAREAKADG
jgi:tRNA threonylcarbamoyladenosine biosynthesis protein TsaB